MLKRSLQVAMIAAAFAAGSAQASDYVTAGGTPVRTGFGECVRTGYWTEPSVECEPEPEAGAQEAPLQLKSAEMPAAQDVSYSAEVLFAFDSAALDAEGKRMLDLLLGQVGPEGLEKVYVTTYADRIGGGHYNLLLSQRRLEAIRNYLAEKGVTLPQLVADARGEEEPATKGACDALKPENRKNAALVECLRPDRRAEVTVAGRLIRSGDASKRIEASAGDSRGRPAVEGQ